MTKFIFSSSTVLTASIMATAVVIFTCLHTTATPFQNFADATGVAQTLPPTADGIDRLKMSSNLSTPDDNKDLQLPTESASRISGPGLLLVWFPLTFAGGWIASVWWRSRTKGDAIEFCDTAAINAEHLRSYITGPDRVEDSVKASPHSDNRHQASDYARANETLKMRLARRDNRIGMLKKRIKKLNKELRDKRDHRKRIRASDSIQDLKTLRHQMLAKNEIIASLEEIVGENREKWLQRDASEAALQRKVAELSADLKMAMRLVDDRHRDAG